MSKYYRRKYRKNSYDDGLELLGIFIIGIISIAINFVIKHWKIILTIIVVLVILFVFIRFRKQIKEKIHNMNKNRYIKKLKKYSELYQKIELINAKYKFNIKEPLFFEYPVRFKSNLETCNIDDYLLKTIDDNMENIKNYAVEYQSYLDEYKKYELEYQLLEVYINEVDSSKVQMSLNKYYKYQKELFNNYKQSKVDYFKLIIVLKYSSPKGKVNKKIYKEYNYSEYLIFYEEYNNLKNTRQIYEINSRIERAKMSNSLRNDIFKRDNYRCCICGKSARDGVRLEVDHIIPVSKGGKTIYNNLQTLCDRCNNGKSNKM